MRVVPLKIEPLPGLTGIRGTAALAVFLSHLQPIALHFFGFNADRGLRIIGSGFRGVDLFFILSGFILFHVHSREFVTLDMPAAGNFYVLRFFRVYPLNTVVLLLMVPLPFVLPQFVDWHRVAHLTQGAYHARDFSFPAFVPSLLLAQTWIVPNPGTWNEPAWTLSAEVVGYFCFPVLAVLANRLHSGISTTLLALGSLTTFVLLMIAGGHATNNPSGIFGIVRMAFCFAAGVSLCRTFQVQPGLRSIAPFLTLASALLVLLCLWQTKVGILSVFGFAGLIFGLAYQVGPIASFMTTRIVMWLGRVSFSFYIVHLIILELFEWFCASSATSTTFPPLARLAVFVGALALPFCVAALTYRFVEVPFQKMGRRITVRLALQKRASQAV